MSELPKGWAVSNLADLAVSLGGGTPSKADSSYWTDGKVPWVSPKDMKVFDLRETEDRLAPKALERLSLVPPNSILIVVRSGILSRILPVALNTMPVTVNQDMRAFVPAKGVLPRYLAWQIVAKERVILDTCSKDGTTVASIEGRALAHFPLSLAPEREQTRIVAKLEELLSDLDAGMAELKAARKKLAQYRLSLLKAAVEGALTADWRSRHKPAETGAQLLERILQERRARWETRQLAKFKEQGKAPPKDWQKKYPEPVQPDTADLPELPEGWVWASVDQLTVEQKYGSSSKTNEGPAGVPVLRMGNIQDGDLDLSSLKYLSRDHDEFPGLHLQDGDLLFNRTNSPELVGKTAVYRSQITPCSFASYLIGVRFSGGYMPELASTFINSVHGKRWIKSVVVQQVGQANVNGSKLSALAIPVPPFDEQKEIVSALHARISEIVDQLKYVDISLKQSTAQRQNILRAAFAGQLIPQDPNDEPASVLLEHIRAERAAAHSEVKKPRGRKAKEAA